jgi:hypothetical protein
LMLVALPSSSTSICLGNIFDASVIVAKGCAGEMAVFFGESDNLVRVSGAYLCNS